MPSASIYDDTSINFHLPVFGFIMAKDPATGKTASKWLGTRREKSSYSILIFNHLSLQLIQQSIWWFSVWDSCSISKNFFQL